MDRMFSPVWFLTVLSEKSPPQKTKRMLAVSRAIRNRQAKGTYREDFCYKNYSLSMCLLNWTVWTFSTPIGRIYLLYHWLLSYISLAYPEPFLIVCHVSLWVPFFARSAAIATVEFILAAQTDFVGVWVELRLCSISRFGDTSYTSSNVNFMIDKLSIECLDRTRKIMVRVR